MSAEKIDLQTIAFIGVGNMAKAIIKGLIASGVSSTSILGTSRTEAKRKDYAESMGITMLADNSAAVAAADMVVLCVKPIQMQAVIADFAGSVRPEHLFVSVAAGLELPSLTAGLGAVAVVRSMPNTPSQLRSGMSGLVANPYVLPHQRQWVEQLFASVGQSLWVENEQQMHTVTALSGSSPAYFFRFLEAMIAYAETQGMDNASARKLATYSMLGAARMATELEDSLAQMRINITSPKGTTEQALLSFEASEIDQVVAKAMQACENRSKEFAEQLADKTMR